MPRPRVDIVSHRTRGGVLVAAIHRASIGQIEAAEIAEHLVPVITDTGTLRGFVLDLADVEYLNSAGLGMIIDLGNRAKERGAKVFACNMREETKALFELMKIGRLFGIETDVDAAVKAARR